MTSLERHQDTQLDTAIHRISTRLTQVASLPLGGCAPVSVQTMLKQSTENAGEAVRSIQSLVEITPESLSSRDRELLKLLGMWDAFLQSAPARCDLVRLGIPDENAVSALPEIVRDSPVPVVADIHFDARLALGSVRAGAHKIRINPGNISDHVLLKELADECRSRKVPIRVGVNAGSLDKTIRATFGSDLVAGAVHSAMESLKLMESFGFEDLVVSIKTSTAVETIRACESIASQCRYPLHLGVTEAGVGESAIVHSWVGVGALLARGIGSTIRISLTESPALEVVCGHLLLKSLNLR